MEGLDARRPQHSSYQRIGAITVILLVVGTALAQFGMALATSDTLYLHGDGIAVASMSHQPPDGTGLPKHAVVLQVFAKEPDVVGMLQRQDSAAIIGLPKVGKIAGIDEQQLTFTFALRHLWQFQ